MKPKIIYGTAWKKDDTTRLAIAANAAGFTAFDTANQPKHYQEALLGNAVSQLRDKGIIREQLFLQSKFTPIDGQDHRVPYDKSRDIPNQVRESFDSSLKHLQTDYLDSYLLHGPYGHSSLAHADWEVWGVLEELYKAGTVKAIGISNVGSSQLAELIAKSEINPHVVQDRCYSDKGWNRATRKLCQEHGITYQGFSVLTANPSVVASPVLASIAKRLGRTVEQIVYRFCIQVGIVPLCGTTNAMHMTEAIEVLQFEITAEEVATIEALMG